MKFTFKSKFQGFGSPETTMEFEADSLNDVITYFEQFLRGAGYHFDGVLDIVPPDDEMNYDDDNNEEIFVDYGKSDYSDFQVNCDVTSPVTFNWTADQLAKDITDKFVINPSETNVEYNLTGQGKHINLTINEEVTSLSKTVCPVCKLPTSTMQNHTCYDPNCGMKS